MGTFGDSVYSDESQGSQPLNNAVLTGPIAGSLSRNPLPSGSYSVREDLSVPSARHSQLPYHLHGLAATQSQSQPKDMTLFREDSQKENTPTPASHNLVNCKPPELRETALDSEIPNSNNAGASTAETPSSVQPLSVKRGLPCDAATLPNTTPAACSSRLDPLTNAKSNRTHDRPGPPRMDSRRMRRRSLSTLSEDSFAGPLPRDLQQKKYMKESKAFQQPLSELDDTQDESHSDEEVLTKGVDKSPPTKPSRTRFRELSVTRTSSQSQSQPPASQSELSQLFNNSGSFAQAQSEEDDDFFLPPNQPRSSLGEHNPYSYTDTQQGQSKPESLVNFIATQLTETSTPEPTQPDDDVMLPPDGHPQQSGATSTTTGGPQSILSMVNPDKWWRFNKDKAALAQARLNYGQTQLTEHPEQPVAGPSNWEETQPSESSNRPTVGQSVDDKADEPIHASAYEETQPSEASKRPDTGYVDDGHEGENQSFEATQLTPASNFPATGSTTHPSTSVQALAPTSSRHFSSSDMEIIPDSEPTQPTPAQHSASSLANDGPLSVITNDVDMHIDPKPVEEEEEEEEGGDSDIPLAFLAATKAKSKPTPGKAVPQEASEPMMPPPRKRTRTDPLPVSAVKSLFAEDELVPSSDPQERLLEASAKAREPSRPARGKPKKAATAPPVTPARSRGHDVEDSDDETAISGNPAPSARDEDALTELADDEADQLVGRGSTSRKRKRPAASSVRGSARSLRTNTYTPPIRSAKRLKSGSIARTITASPTRVFALWKQDSYYYVGTIHSECGTSPQKYIVHFDDGEQDAVDLSKLRRCELRKGDYVMVKDIPKPLKGEVVDASRCATDRKVVIRLEDEEPQEFSTEELLIPSRSIVSKWADRMLTTDEIITIVNPRPRVSPTPSKHGDISTWSRGTRKIFSKVGFVTTMAPGQDDWEKEKENLKSAIKDSGGMVIDDWCEVFKMEGTMSAKGKRWVLRKDEIKLLKDIDRLFLLADDASHKPKFLIALALGVPCIKLDWLSASISAMEEREWLSYLLPAGTSETLDARVSQMVDIDWGSCKEHILDIADSSVPPKLFKGLNILCVSPEFVQAKPARRGKNDEKAHEATRMIPRIILCMGSESVESVATLDGASKALKDYNYIVFREHEEAKKAAKTRHLDTCVPFCWIKECLITGRLLPRDG